VVCFQLSGDRPEDHEVQKSACSGISADHWCALQKIGEFDNADEASAAAGIRKDKKNRVVVTQLRNPTNTPSKPTAASSSGGSYYFIYTFQLEDAITDVDIKAKLALRGTAAARRESKQDRRRSKAGTRS
jgi:hypothetical protein